jgi:hypothetical protein
MPHGNKAVHISRGIFGEPYKMRKNLIGDVAPLLSSPNKVLALAAERYLEAEDSLEARNIILSKFADETRPLGA